mmetsp:Transcript_94952/g.220398  ORF Transcript_94952/g.220398 Transcript_94952/m.220398 type:complete len:236 (+) Transcript_94952:124-831(+)
MPASPENHDGTHHRGTACGKKPRLATRLELLLHGRGLLLKAPDEGLHARHAAFAFVRTTPGLLHWGPSGLPVVERNVAVLWWARRRRAGRRRPLATLALVRAAPSLLHRCPRCLPIVERDVAVLRWARGRRRGHSPSHAAFSFMLATPGLLRRTPRILPIVESHVTVHRRARGGSGWRRRCRRCWRCRRRRWHRRWRRRNASLAFVMTAVGLLCVTPSGLPIVEGSGAIHRRARR